MSEVQNPWSQAPGKWVLLTKLPDEIFAAFSLNPSASTVILRAAMEAGQIHCKYDRSEAEIAEHIQDKLAAGFGFMRGTEPEPEALITDWSQVDWQRQTVHGHPIYVSWMNCVDYIRDNRERFDLVAPRRGPVGTVVTEPTLTSTKAAEVAARRWLITLMQDSNVSPIPKVKCFNMACAKIPRLGRRGFNRAWTSAIKETGATHWSGPGRKS